MLAAALIPIPASAEGKGGGKGKGKHKAKRRDWEYEDAYEDDSDPDMNELMTIMLRQVLLTEEYVAVAKSSFTYIVIYKSETVENDMVEGQKLYAELMPKKTAEQRESGTFVPHPRGRPEHYFKQLLILLLATIPGPETEKIRPMIERRELTEQIYKDATVRYKPRYREPKEGVSWIWFYTMRASASPVWTQFMNSMVKQFTDTNDPMVSIDWARKVQSTDTKVLWAILKDRQKGKGKGKSKEKRKRGNNNQRNEEAMNESSGHWPFDELGDLFVG